MSDKPRILVIEDEQSVANMMVFLLASAGCNAQAALNTDQAMRLAQNGDFDLITLDVNMPGMNGIELCRRLKQMPRLSKTPVVFVSGQACNDNIRRGMEAGAVDFITKPFYPTDFVSRILSYVRLAQNPSSFPDKVVDENPQNLCDTP